MRKRNLLLGILVMTSSILCACGNKAETEEKNTTTKVEEQQSSSVTDETTEQITTEQPTTEQPTTEVETTAPKITQCQNISEIIGMDIFTLEGIDGPKPT